MQKPDEKEALQLALDHYGIQAQLNKLVEECAELIVAIRHHQDRQKDPIEMFAEMADVEIMLAQMRVCYGDFFIDREKGKKITRLAERLGLINIPLGKVSYSPAEPICVLYEDESDTVDQVEGEEHF